MKFSTTLAAAFFGITTQALAVPAPVSERGLINLGPAAVGPVAVIQADLNSLGASVASDLALATGALGNITNDVQAGVQLIAFANVNLQAIVATLLSTTTQLVGATAGSVISLNPVNVTALVGALGQFEGIVADITVSLQTGLASIPPATAVLLASELAILNATIGAIEVGLAAAAVPLTTYAAAVQTALGKTSGSISGIPAAISSLTSAIAGIGAAIGL